MRIAHVSDCYLPRTGGIETQVRALALHQAEAGDDVRIITATPGREVARGADVVDGLPIDRLTMRLPADLPIHLRTRAHVLTALREHPVDVVHVHAGVISPFAWGAVRAAREAGLPMLVTVHSIWGLLATRGFAASDALLRWSRWGAAISAVSDIAARRIERSVPAIGQVHVVPNGIDPTDWQVEHVPSAGEFRLATVMRLAPRKRIIPLLRMVADAAPRIPQGVRLTVVGDGPERARAERFARKAGIADRVHFAGRLDREDIRHVLAHADAYVQPSIKESFGIAALEARSAGVPLVIHADTGTTQFVRDGVEGLIGADDAAMSRAIVRLATEPGLVDRIAEHNRSVPPADTWPNVLIAVRNAYAAAHAAAGATG